MPLLTTLLLLRIRHLVPLGLRISTHPTTGMEMVELQRVMYPKKSIEITNALWTQLEARTTTREGWATERFGSVDSLQDYKITRILILWYMSVHVFRI